MDLKERFNILTQGVQIAQRKGVLTLDDAVVAKSAIDWVDKNINLDAAARVFVRIAELGQSKGCYTLKDAHYLYVASNGIYDLISSDVEEEKTEE